MRRPPPCASHLLLVADVAHPPADNNGDMAWILVAFTLVFTMAPGASDELLRPVEASSVPLLPGIAPHAPALTPAPWIPRTLVSAYSTRASCGGRTRCRCCSSR